MKTILCFSHEQNTFDKRKLLQNPHPDYVKESTKSVDDFIKLPNEAKIKKFFMEDVDKLLENYAPGNPQMKPDVLKQIAEIEANRDKMIREEMAKQSSQQIMLNQPGKEPVPLSTQQVVELLSKQGQQIQMYEQRIKELENVIVNLQRNLNNVPVFSMNGFSTANEVKPAHSTPSPIANVSKSDPLITLDPSMFS
jgi:hypothetical protein